MAKKLKPIFKSSAPFKIMEAALKDGFCNYSYDITEGVGIGDTHKVKGKGVITDDLKDAFTTFNVHLAVIDDVFKHSNVNIPNIDKFHNHELTGLYEVTGIKIKGVGDNETVELVGTKYVNAGDRISLVTPRITLDQLSSYPWYNELASAVERARMEVEEYKNGKCTAVQEELNFEEDLKQLKITEGGGHDDDEVFEKAKVKDKKKQS